MNQIYLAQDKDQWKTVGKTEMKRRVPYTVGKFLSRCIICDFSRRNQLHKVS
jgi:hypothetical protein